jgi:hypothetical protein
MLNKLTVKGRQVQVRHALHEHLFDVAGRRFDSSRKSPGHIAALAFAFVKVMPRGANTFACIRRLHAEASRENIKACFDHIAYDVDNDLCNASCLTQLLIEAIFGLF